MQKHLFIRAKSPALDLSAGNIAARLVLHLLRLHAARAVVDLSRHEDRSLYDVGGQRWPGACPIVLPEDRLRIP
ncbi:hypothetical protein [Paracoccus sp. T5]|uniref:hypothetical protein n=1 Tax=Paracoccus sp. T5 TaxID=3402161 RepID=UPI003ADFA5A0